MIGFGFSVFTQAILGLGGGFRGSALNLDFTSGSRTLDPRITFSRTTNATLTNSAGLVANAPMNLLTFSEQFDNAAWIKSGGGVASAPVVTANAGVAPDGTTTADQVVFNINGGETFADLSGISAGSQAYNSGITITQSVYIKTTDNTSKIFSYVSIDGLQTTITVTGVWQRFVMTVTPTSSGTNAPMRLRLRGGEGTSSSASIYIWGAQLELGSTATTYNPTTVKNLLGYTEHFDNAAWTKSNAFVQTNLLTYSQDFDNAAWTSAFVAVTPNTVTAPDGTTTADTVTAQASTNYHDVEQLKNSAVAASTAMTISVYLKANTHNFASLIIESATPTAWVACAVNLSTGSITQTGAGAGGTYTASSIASVGNNWYRVSLTGSTTAVFNKLKVALNSSAAPTWGNYANESWTSVGTESIYVWGAQLVQGTSAGDYKATYAAAAAVGYSDIYGQPFAQKLVATATTSNHLCAIGGVALVAGIPFTASFYAKAGEYSFAQVTLGGNAGNAYANFDLSTGTVASVGNSPIATSIEAIGNGWYRCALVSAPLSTASSGPNISVLNSDLNSRSPSYTGDGTSGIYIFGAQLSDSASVDPYVYNPVAAPSSVAYYGPRFDYDPVTRAPKGLLIEEQRTNLLLRSEEFDNGYWLKSGSTTVSANVIAAPDGSLTADRVSGASGTDFTGSVLRLNAAIAPTSSSNTASVYVIADGATTMRMYYRDGATGIVYSTAAISLTTSWQRITLAIPTANLGILFLGAADGNFGIWGAQLEAGAFATSYIPTVASQVTRAADSASMIGNNFARWYNATQGTLFAQFDTPASGNRPVLSVGDGTANNMIQLRTEATDPYFRVTTGGVAQAGLDVGTVAANTTYKMTGAYEANNFSACINAGVVGSDTSGTVSVVTRMLLGSDQAGSYLNGHISRAAAYGRVLAATEQQGVTA